MMGLVKKLSKWVLWRSGVASLFLALLSGCGTVETPSLTEAYVERLASAGPFQPHQGNIVVDNDAAFQAKLDLVRRAEASIDAMYYIYADDLSSSIFSHALIDAAKRGVKVRLLVDYLANYSRLDHFSMMERKAREAGGSLEVRFFNRPTRNIIKNAAYLTSGCVDNALDSPNQACAREKAESIDTFFAGERFAGTEAQALNISNRNTGLSGVFLSGLYAKEPEVMAYAVTAGLGFDPKNTLPGGPEINEDDKRQLAEFGKLYWRAKTSSGFAKLAARIRLALAFALYGDTISPIFNQFTAVIPVDAPWAQDAARDWEYFTQFIHHKLLLADDRWVQLGGRNIEDSYHMQPNELIDKYVFMDTDLRADLGEGSRIALTFDRVWNFRTMVASLEEVRLHAPNDIVTNLQAWLAAQSDCEGQGEPDIVAKCTGFVFAERAFSQIEREDAAYARMLDNMATYKSRYRPRIANLPELAIEPGAELIYLENLVFKAMPETGELTRQFKTTNGREAEDGKNIHALWLSVMKATCRQSRLDGEKRRVVLHNAYFFLSSNFVTALAKMIDGTWNCANVDVMVLTNSMDTTDLSVVNLFARHGAKAFSEYYLDNRAADRGAQIRYLGYVRRPNGPWLSLHSKVMVIGDSLFVGSANLDVRSFVLDTNNGFWVRNAPGLVDGYLRFVDQLAANSDRVENKTAYFAETSRKQMLEEDIATFSKIVEKYLTGRRTDQSEIEKLERRAVQVMDETYALTKQLLKRGTGAEEAAETFNRRFKAI